MKTSKIYALGAMLLSALTFAACSDSDDYSGPGEWNANSDYTRVAFATTSENVELDPVEATTLPITLVRTNAGGELNVPITIERNDSNVFTLTQAQFAAGDTTATFYANFPAAEIGTAYTLKLLIEDPSVASFYSANNTYELTVTRVKWNLLGTGTFFENFIYGGTSEVEIYQKDGDYNTYRVMHPFDGIVYSDGTNNLGELDGNQSEYTVLTISEKGEPFATEDEASTTGLVHFTTMNSGYYHSSYGADIKLYHPASFRSLQSESDWAYSYVREYQADGRTPGEIQLAPYYYMDGVGGWDETSEDGDDAVVVITFPGFTPTRIYEAQVPSDFTWQNVFDGNYESAQLGTSNTRTLQVGTCTATQDNADSTFAATYGTLYRIQSAYADGFDLYFTVKSNGTFAVPAGFETQNIGLTAVGDSVYAKINTSDCQYSAAVITLNITFQNEDGSIVYGTANEVLSNITWTAIGTGTYTYGSGMFDDDDATSHATDQGLTLSKRDDRNDTYKISNWGFGVDFTFTWNQTTNECTVPEQEAGYTHPSYGTIYVGDMNAFGGYSYSNYPCYYDPDTQTFHFYIAYYVSAGYFAYGDETFQVTFSTNGTAQVKKHSFRAIPSGKLRVKNGQYKRKTVWKGHRVSVSSQKASRLSTGFSPVQMNLFDNILY